MKNILLLTQNVDIFSATPAAIIILFTLCLYGHSSQYVEATTCLSVNVNPPGKKSTCISHGLKKIPKRKEAEGDCRRMNELVKGQR